MKILFLTDSHIRGTTPKNRLDDFPSTLEKKFEEIVKIVKYHKVDFILHGGDLFDRPDVSISIMSRFAPILKSINVPIYTICGNHDIFGHNPSTINRTMLGLLNALDIVHVVNKNEKVLLKKGELTVQLTGSPYTYNIDTEENRSSYIVKDVDKNADFAIHMVHGMLLNKPFIKGVPYTLVEDITHTKADITFCGHYHTGFNVLETNNKYFVNPGSLVRISNSLAEIERTPQVALVQLQDTINISLIKLRAAAKGNKVLNRQEIENHIFKSEKLFQFKQSIDAAMDYDKLDVNEVLIEVSNAKGVDEEVKQEALRRITNSQMKELEGSL